MGVNNFAVVKLFIVGFGFFLNCWVGEIWIDAFCFIFFFWVGIRFIWESSICCFFLFKRLNKVVKFRDFIMVYLCMT